MVFFRAIMMPLGSSSHQSYELSNAPDNQRLAMIAVNTGINSFILIRQFLNNTIHNKGAINDGKTPAYIFPAC